MGAFETGALALVEAKVKYHPAIVVTLTSSPDRGEGHSKTGSLTGAVASQIVTEAREATLRLFGNQPSSAKA